MLKSQTNASGVEYIDEVNHSFVRLPLTGTVTVFQGWGPRI